MNKPLTRITAGHIDPALIDDIIARAVALRARPSRFGVEYLNFLCAVDVVVGNDALTDEIADLESDLGFTEAEPLGDDRQHDEGWTYGLYNGELDLCPTARISPTSVAA